MKSILAIFALILLFCLLKLQFASASGVITCDQSLKSSPLIGHVEKAGNLAGGFLSRDSYSVRDLEAWADNATSVEEFIKNLPLGLRQDFIPVISSESTQFGDRSSPRVVVTNSTSQFLLTYSSKENERGYSFIEAAIFDEGAEEYKPYELSFIGGKSSLTAGTQCAVCHGNPWRPIWSSYAFWPGTYGSSQKLELNNSGSMELTRIIYEAEQDAFENYLDQRKTNPRLRPLRTNRDLKSAETKNFAITYNLVIIRARQIAKAFLEETKDNKQLYKALKTISLALSDYSEDPFDLRPLLPDDLRDQFDAEYDDLLRYTKETLTKERKSGLERHLVSLGIERSIDDSEVFEWNTDNISDQDLNFVVTKYSNRAQTNKRMSRKYQAFAALYFVWVRALGQSFDRLNMSLDEKAFPRLATPLKNGWAYVYQSL